MNILRKMIVKKLAEAIIEQIAQLRKEEAEATKKEIVRVRSAIVKYDKYVPGPNLTSYIYEKMYLEEKLASLKGSIV